MPLQDHFKPPLSIRRHWHAFHNAWATYIASDLNRKLPKGYFAEPNVQFGIEIDVTTFEEVTDKKSGNNVARFPTSKSKKWSPPSPTVSVPFNVAPDTVEINLYNNEAGPVLMAAIELVSPANKDRAANRKAFVSKCETYLQQGIGLVIVDVVTDRKANLHDELLSRLSASKSFRMNVELYATAIV